MLLEVRAGLGEVQDELTTVGRLLAHAQARVGDALAVLTELSAQHHESLVPPELHRADAELTRARQLTGGGGTVVAAIDARL